MFYSLYGQHAVQGYATTLRQAAGVFLPDDIQMNERAYQDVQQVIDSGWIATMVREHALADQALSAQVRDLILAQPAHYTCGTPRELPHGWFRRCPCSFDTTVLRCQLCDGTFWNPVARVLLGPWNVGDAPGW